MLLQQETRLDDAECVDAVSPSSLVGKTEEHYLQRSKGRDAPYGASAVGLVLASSRVTAGAI